MELVDISKSPTLMVNRHPILELLKKQTSYLGTAENGDGFLTTFNSDGKKTTFLGTAKEGGFGFLTTFNDGKQTTFLGTSEGGSGILETFNKHGVMVGYFGSN